MGGYSGNSDKTKNIPKFGGTIWYVNTGSGDNNNCGKDFRREILHEKRELRANDGILVRMMNLSDDLATTFDMTILFED